MKRILCLISGMNTGGAETFLMKIYRKLDKTKYQMDFCVNVFDKCFYDDEIINLGGKIYHIPAKSKSLIKFKKNLTKIIKTNNYKYVMRISSNAFGFWDLKLAKKAGASICVARSSNSSDGGGIKNFITHSLGKILFNKYCDIKIAPSDLAAKYTFGKKLVEKGKVLYLNNAIDLDYYAYSIENRDKIRQEFHLSNKLVIGHIGRFSYQKNHKFLLDVFKSIVDKNNEAVLLLCGDGILKNEIIEYAKELNIFNNIIFTGIRSDIQSILSAIDVVLFPSFYEGMPNVIIEAQASGLNCIVSDTITREVNVTGLVKFISLNSSCDLWADVVLNNVSKDRKKTKSIMKNAGYDINDSVLKFVDSVFIK